MRVRVVCEEMLWGCGWFGDTGQCKLRETHSWDSDGGRREGRHRFGGREGVCTVPVVTGQPGGCRPRGAGGLAPGWCGAGAWWYSRWLTTAVVLCNTRCLCMQAGGCAVRSLVSAHGLAAGGAMGHAPKGLNHRTTQPRTPRRACRASPPMVGRRRRTATSHTWAPGTCGTSVWHGRS